MDITEKQLQLLEHHAIQIEKDAVIDDDVSGGHLPEPYKSAVNAIYQIIEEVSASQKASTSDSALPISDVVGRGEQLLFSPDDIERIIDEKSQFSGMQFRRYFEEK